MEKIEELVKEIARINGQLQQAHRALDEYFCHGRYQMGFGPVTQSEIIRGCDERLAEIRKELIKLGFTDDEAAKICRNPPPQGLSFEACLVFIARYS